MQNHRAKNNSLAAFALVLCGAALQMGFLPFGHVRYDLALAGLIVAAEELTLYELIASVVISFWIVHWEPALGIESLVFMAVPLFSWIVSRFVRSTGYLGVIGNVGLGVGFFYAVVNRGGVWASFDVFLWDVAVSVLFGLLGFEWLHRDQDVIRAT